MLVGDFSRQWTLNLLVVMPQPRDPSWSQWLRKASEPEALTGLDAL